MDIAAFASLGVGGLVAYLMLHWKREDDKQYRENVRELADRSMTLHERTLEAIVANTKAMNALIDTVNSVAALQEIKGRLDGIEKAVSKNAEQSPPRQ